MICECCLSPRAPLELGSPHVHRGAREVYCNMLLECFGLEVPAEGHICKLCVTQLRSAAKFRHKVALSQDTLARRRSAHHPNTISPSDVIPESYVEIKLEEVGNCHYEPEVTADVVENPFGMIKNETSHDYSLDDDNDLSRVAKLESLTEMKNDNEEVTDTHVVVKLEPVSPVKPELKVIPKKRSHRKKQSVSNAEVPPVTEEQNADEKLKQNLMETTMTIMSCSNATPFIKKIRSFRCFYCRTQFPQPEMLIEHTRMVHVDLKQAKTALLRYAATNYIVYFDITDLACTLCWQSINSIDDLRAHLQTEHNKKLDPSCDRNVPFKLISNVNSNVFVCQKCEEKFQSLGRLEQHMNKHYRNYICKQCETGYMTQKRLVSHEKYHTSFGKFSCHCGKTFTNAVTFKIHDDVAHKKLLKSKCPHCSKRFSNYVQRGRHLASVHNAKPMVYKCDICETDFQTPVGLKNHTRKFHLQELNFSCRMCSYQCYSNANLQRHMVRHVGVKKYECDFCNKMYTRKHILREHLRIHYNDKRFVCSVCNKAFVQKASLHGHMRAHHSDGRYYYP